MAWPLVLYGTLVLAMDLGANGLMNSKARLLLPAFTLLIPAAIGFPPALPALPGGFLHLDMHHGFRHLAHHTGDGPGIAVQQLQVAF